MLELAVLGLASLFAGFVDAIVGAQPRQPPKALVALHQLRLHKQKPAIRIARPMKWAAS